MELVIPIDEPDSEMELREYLEEQNLSCSYIIKSNKITHNWRNHAPVTNVGIRMSNGEYVLVMSPETICVNDMYSILLNACIESEIKNGFPNAHIGRVAFCKKSDMVGGLNNIFSNKFRDVVYRGSMCIKKTAIEAVHGYSEKFTEWGREDDDLRARLYLMGYGKTIKVWNAKAIHYEDNITRPSNLNPIVNFSIPDNPIVNDENWGHDF